MKEKVSLTCLNPQGAVDIAPPSGLTAPRVKDLAGKKVGIFWDGKKGGDNFYESSRVPFEELTLDEIKGSRDRMNTKPGGVFFANDAIAASQLPLFRAALKPGGKVPVVNPDDIHLIVSGSIPGYSFGMSYMRSAHKTKRIQGAKLTRSGR